MGGLVTPPLSGFSPSRFRSPAKGKPCPQDVDRRVHVGVRGMPARRTGELGLGETVLLCHVPAPGAGAGGVGGVHRDQLSTGAFSLVRENRQEHPPTRVEDASVERGLGSDVPSGLLDRARSGAGHVRDPQVLVHDHVVVADQRVRRPVCVIESLAADLAVQCGDPCHLLATAFGPALLAGEAPLRGGEAISGRGEVTRVGHVRTVRRRDKRGHTHIQADHSARGGKRLGGHAVTGEDHIPAGAFPPHADRLDGARHAAVLVHADMPDALQPHERRGGVLGLGVPSAAVTVLRPLDRVEPAPALETGEAGPTTLADPLEEPGERLVQAAQGGLSGGERPTRLPVRVISTDVLRLARLIAVPDRHACLAVGGAAVLRSGVVELTVVFQARGECSGLLGGGSQEELERPNARSPPLDGRSSCVSM
ncbi:hypothetical protein SAMN05421874_10433 [Nonomuraea maritima]|uniref:Uncharacterized protein n=1 Tax=Nonomuraea maritima TaxID=683260 RepID=A0A1G8XKJ8_9ACTN|nr:hypothetical protein SAMN05421874_10433 [Nonomuraea maritima]